MKIAINGFGRIGRQLLRLCYNDPELDVALINDLGNADTLTHLFKYDSVHGKFEKNVKNDSERMEINLDTLKDSTLVKAIKLTSCKDMMEVPFKDLDIDMVFECTGVFTEREKAQLLLNAGAKRVMISAPAKNPDATFVYGVNHESFNPETHKIISNASCTTNCLAPVAMVLNKELKIKCGLMTTIHSYTNDQKILDLPHKDLRRARAAAMSMIPTTTGAAKAVGLVIPELKGKISGLAVRVPTPNVSLVDFVCEVEKSVTKDEVNNMLREASNSYLKGVMDVTDEPVVSIDFNGCQRASTVDLSCTDVINGNMVKVLAWYDNEVGYSRQMLNLTQYISSKK